MDYRTFEGNIPMGQYGGGPVIVWDEGWYELSEGDDAAEEIANGKIKFVMHGHKMHGEFTLVKMKPKEGESGDPWLLIKDHLGAEKSYDINDFPQSVKTGRTIEEVKADRKSAVWQSKPRNGETAAKPKPKAQKLPLISDVELATLIDAPFDDPDWLFEIKWDGYRALVTVEADGTLSVTSRNGQNFLAQFPQLAALSGAFSSVPIIVDGEIVALDDDGRSDFQRLQGTMSKRTQLTFVAFDLLYADGKDLRKTPLEKRKALLERLIADEDLVMYSKHVVGNGTALFEQAQAQHLEGIIGKKRDSVYVGRRTRDWVKIKAQNESEFVIGGFTDPKGSRKGFGALLLGVPEGKKLRYVGHVGTGFSIKRLAEITKELRALERAESPFTEKIATNTKAHWVQPQLVAQVRYTEMTRDGILRHPAFLGIRVDKDAEDVTEERPSAAPKRKRKA